MDHRKLRSSMKNFQISVELKLTEAGLPAHQKKNRKAKVKRKERKKYRKEKSKNNFIFVSNHVFSLLFELRFYVSFKHFFKGSEAR